jgi:hypothetical protein
MPIKVEGLLELRKAMQEFAPEFEVELDKNLAKAMDSIVKKARGFIPASSTLSNWARPAKNPSRGRARAFPVYNVLEMRRGIKAITEPSSVNRKGFISHARVENISAAGAIYETAGRKNKNGQKKDPYLSADWSTLPKNQRYYNSTHKYSASNNPNAGKQFIAAMPKLYDANPKLKVANDSGSGYVGAGRASRKWKGRAIFRAYVEDKGRTVGLIMKAKEDTEKRFLAKIGNKAA